MKVFLDIDIGDAAKYEQESAAYHRAVDFMQQCGSQYGLSGSLADLDDEGLQMLREGYSSDPSWSSKGGLLASVQHWLHQWCCCRTCQGCTLQSIATVVLMIWASCVGIRTSLCYCAAALGDTSFQSFSSTSNCYCTWTKSTTTQLHTICTAATASPAANATPHCMRCLSAAAAAPMAACAHDR
jgi:hypothetical protein